MLRNTKVGGGKKGRDRRDERREGRKQRSKVYTVYTLAEKDDGKGEGAKDGKL